MKPNLDSGGSAALRPIFSLFKRAKRCSAKVSPHPAPTQDKTQTPPIAAMDQDVVLLDLDNDDKCSHACGVAGRRVPDNGPLPQHGALAKNAQRDFGGNPVNIVVQKERVGRKVRGTLTERGVNLDEMSWGKTREDGVDDLTFRAGIHRPGQGSHQKPDHKVWISNVPTHILPIEESDGRGRRTFSSSDGVSPDINNTKVTLDDCKHGRATTGHSISPLKHSQMTNEQRMKTTAVAMPSNAVENSRRFVVGSEKENILELPKSTAVYSRIPVVSSRKKEQRVSSMLSPRHGSRLLTGRLDRQLRSEIIWKNTETKTIPERKNDALTEVVDSGDGKNINGIGDPQSSGSLVPRPQTSQSYQGKRLNSRSKVQKSLTWEITWKNDKIIRDDCTMEAQTNFHQKPSARICDVVKEEKGGLPASVGCGRKTSSCLKPRNMPTRGKGGTFAFGEEYGRTEQDSSSEFQKAKRQDRRQDGFKASLFLKVMFGDGER